MEHSKLPWKNHVTDVYSGEFGKGKRIALGCEPEDAAFIVKACNEYDALKAKAGKLDAATNALREIKIIACRANYLNYEGTCEVYNMALDAHNAAISQTKPESAKELK